MTPSAEVRRAGDDDADAVADVLIRSRGAAYPAIPAAVHDDDETRTWVREHLLVATEVWVAEVGDRGVVGVLSLDGDRVEQLYVSSDWAGRGVGTRLLAHAMLRSPTGLQLWTFASNTQARRFYARRGFAEVEETDGAGNEEKQPDVRMVWRP